MLQETRGKIIVAGYFVGFVVAEVGDFVAGVEHGLVVGEHAVFYGCVWLCGFLMCAFECIAVDEVGSGFCCGFDGF